MRYSHFPKLLLFFIFIACSICIFFILQGSPHEEKHYLKFKEENRVVNQVVSLVGEKQNNLIKIDSEEASLQIETGTQIGLKQDLIKPSKTKRIINSYDLTIFNDAYSNYISVLSDIDGRHKEYVFSSYPLFKPSNDELNYGIQGCYVSGVYVDYGATLVTVSQQNDEIKLYSYKCIFNSEFNRYLVEKTPMEERIKKSIHGEFGNIEIVNMNEYGEGDHVQEPEFSFGPSSEDDIDEPEI